MNLFRHVVCPFCGTKHDTTTAALDPADTPDPGDPTLCFSCGEWLIFALVPGGVRKPTDEEYVHLAEDVNCRAMRKVWADMKTAGEW